jgi:hypothetical protein
MFALYQQSQGTWRGEESEPNDNCDPTQWIRIEEDQDDEP